MSRSQNLYQLQQIDTKMDQIHERLGQIETLLSGDANLRKATILANKAKRRLGESEKALRQAEAKVKDQRIKIEQTEAALYGGSIRNPKELQDLQNEATSLKRYLEVLEERQLETMMTVDEANAKNQEAQKILEKYRVQAEKKQAILIEEREKLHIESQDLSQQREIAIQLFDAEDLNMYEGLRKQRAGVAVAKVRDQTCGACGSTLTAALYQAARSPSQVVICDSCGRILYAN